MRVYFLLQNHIKEKNYETRGDQELWIFDIPISDIK